VAPVKVLILRAAGINCDLEAQHAWELAGARAERVHVRRLIERPEMLTEYQVLMIPGGFSYGDDIAAGRILAAQLKRHLIAEVRDFVASGRLVLGVCNGFQVLVNAGLLPFGDDGVKTQPQGGSTRWASNGVRACTISYNDPPGFQDRWVNLRATGENCAFLEPGREYEMPIAHGEGRVLFADDDVLHRVLANGLNALAYVPSPPRAGVTPGAPFNPNGSVADIAGLCDPTGRILGLMPHPERFVSWTQHPCWTTEYARAGEVVGTNTGASGEGDGLALFRRAMAYLKG
jgi:phosphoribosylformylglycinamidine synthase subunit PurQ / glutaminase